jgi:hypothetical protein
LSRSSTRFACRPVFKRFARLAPCASLVSLLSLAAASSAIAQAPQYHAPVVAPNSTLNGVDYNSRYEVYGGLAYSHFDAGPSLLQGANLGGLDIQGAYFLTHKWAAVGNLRGYLGTSGAAPNPYQVNGPFVSQYMLMAGPEYRLASNKHASVTLHALAGGTYGYFSKGLGTDENGNKIEPGQVGFFNDQIAFGSAIGGSIDLNRSPSLAFRISPDAILTDFSSEGKGDFKEQFGLSVGLIYRFGHHIDPVRAGAPVHAVR